jgi:hypothetical protein
MEDLVSVITALDLAQPVEVGSVEGDDLIGLVGPRLAHQCPRRHVRLEGGEGVPHPLDVELRVGWIRPVASQQEVEAGFAVGEGGGRRVDAAGGAVVVLDEDGRHRGRHGLVGVEERLVACPSARGLGNDMIDGRAAFERQ